MWLVAMCASPAGAQEAEIDPFAAAGDAGGGANVITTLDFVNTPVRDVFRIISDMTGWSIMLSPEISKTPPKIDLWIKNLPADQALDQIVALAGLTYQRQGATIKVSRVENWRGGGRYRGLTVAGGFRRVPVSQSDP